MSTQLEKVKEELKWAVLDGRNDSAVLALFERAFRVIESLQEALAEVEQDLEAERQDFEALNREFDQYVATHE